MGSQPAVKGQPTGSHGSQIIGQAVAGKPQFSLRSPSSALIALTLFVALNLVLSSCALVRFDSYKFPYRGWSWWLLNDLRQHKQEKHSVALLGSSLMVSAVAGCDANFLNRNLDMTAYHKAAYLDHVLENEEGGSTKFNTYDLAIPGQIPSDAYMALRAMTDIVAPPRVVIYGVAPRDFMDNTLRSPLDTEPCHYLSRVVDYKDLEPGLYNDPLSQFNRFLEQYVYLYQHCVDFQIAAGEAFNRAITSLVPQPWTAHPFTYWDRTRLIPNYHSGELYPTAMIASPVDQKFCAEHFTDNSTDYVDRYKHARPDVFKTQLFFLQKLAALCHKDGIDLILVNMPLTERNVQILTMPRYNAYRDTMSRFACDNDLTFLDLADLKKYSVQDFHDLVHLNGYGAKKFFDNLAAALHTNPVTAARLRAASQPD